MTQFEQLDLLLNEYGGIIQTFQVIDNGISKPVFYSYVKERGFLFLASLCLGPLFSVHVVPQSRHLVSRDVLLAQLQLAVLVLVLLGGHPRTTPVRVPFPTVCPGKAGFAVQSLLLVPLFLLGAGRLPVEVLASADRPASPVVVVCFLTIEVVIFRVAVPVRAYFDPLVILVVLPRTALPE